MPSNSSGEFADENHRHGNAPSPSHPIDVESPNPATSFANNNLSHVESREPLLSSYTESGGLPDLPPPYSLTAYNGYPSAPPYSEVPAITPIQPGYSVRPPYHQAATSRQLHQDEDLKDDMDFFRYSAPCKKIATCVATCIALMVLIIIVFMLVYGKL